MTEILGLIVNIFIGAVEFILAIRLILKLFGASANSQFVAWIYDASRPLITPFVGVFPNPILAGRFVFEFSTLFALLVYAFIGFLIMQFIAMLHKK